MREVRIGDWLLEYEPTTKDIRVTSPRTGPGFTVVSPQSPGLAARLLYALAKALIDTKGTER